MTLAVKAPPELLSSNIYWARAIRQESNFVLTSTNQEWLSTKQYCLFPFSDPAKKEDWFDYKHPYFRKIENKFRFHEVSLINLQSLTSYILGLVVFKQT